MDKEQIKKINRWFRSKERYSGTEKIDDTYYLSSYDLDDFNELLKEVEPDLMYIQMYFKDGIYFFKEDLENARCY